MEPTMEVDWMAAGGAEVTTSDSEIEIVVAEDEPYLAHDVDAAVDPAAADVAVGYAYASRVMAAEGDSLAYAGEAVSVSGIAGAPGIDSAAADVVSYVTAEAPLPGTNAGDAVSGIAGAGIAGALVPFRGAAPRLKLHGPSKRTALEHAYICGKMREARAQKRLQVQSDYFKTMVQSTVDLMKADLLIKSGVTLTIAKKSKKFKKGGQRTPCGVIVINKGVGNPATRRGEAPSPCSLALAPWWKLVSRRCGSILGFGLLISPDEFEYVLLDAVLFFARSLDILDFCC